MAVQEGVDPQDLSKTGWGVIFSATDEHWTAVVKEALAPILKLRLEQAGDRYREYSGPFAYRQGESSADFRRRHGVGRGPADPEKMPYYLFIVADPEDLSYNFQQQLDLQYAVGRIHFDGAPKEEALERYANYAKSVVMAETGRLHAARRVGVFAPIHTQDPYSFTTAETFARPLVENISTRSEQWRVLSYLGEEATKKRLLQLLSGDETPGFLFATGHSIMFKNEDPRQRGYQGALICQDWPGPAPEHVNVSTDMYFSADDVADKARLLGLIMMHIASYSIGMPTADAWLGRRESASHAFVSRLPQRLPSHPEGDGLAVIGMIDRTCSIALDAHLRRNPILPRSIDMYASTIRQILAGSRIGFAVEYCQLRYAELASDFTGMLEEVRFGKTCDDAALAEVWTAMNGLRNVAIFGDPAVRLPISSEV
jgi:hypothetical protein